MTHVIDNGCLGKNTVRALIKHENNPSRRGSRVIYVLALVLALLSVFAASTRVLNAAAQAVTDRPFILPFKEPPGLDTWYLAQTYGNTVGAFFQRDTTYGASQGIHFGIDLSAPCGTELVAMADGVILAADAMSYGSAPHNLLVDHPELGYTVLYGHLLERPQLTPGQQVMAGEVVALSGDPAETCYGRPHLHLEVRDINNRARKVNPLSLIQADWDNLALVGPFSRAFERDLDDPRKWQHLDDQPDAYSGGVLLNDFANPWPPEWRGR
jgi:murein DD-endopeptidase MepM/ murein hydrolase activator NlpD